MFQKYILNQINILINTVAQLMYKNRLLAFAFLLGISLRFILFLLVKPWDQTVLQNIILETDALEYHNLAISILQDGIFPSTIRTPGYPFFLSFLYFLFGIKPYFIIICQIFLDSCTIMLVYSLGNNILDRKSATVAAFLYAIDPIAIYYTNTVRTESMFTFTFLLSIIFLIKYLKKNKIFMIASSGVFLGIGTLIRPISQYFPCTPHPPGDVPLRSLNHKSPCRDLEPLS